MGVRVGERDWTDWGRLFGCDDDDDPGDCEGDCQQRPEDLEERFQGCFTAEFARLWSQSGGWGKYGQDELDVAEEAQAVLDGILSLHEYWPRPVWDYEDADPVWEARRAYLDWSFTDEWGEASVPGELTWSYQDSVRADEEAEEIGEIEEEEDEHEGLPVRMIEDEVGDDPRVDEYVIDEHDEYDGDDQSQIVEYDVDEYGVVEYELGEYERAFGRIDSLTAEQEALLEAHSRRWVEARLRTGRADRAAFELAAGRSYTYAGIPWHDNVIWVGSPVVLVVAAKLALAMRRQRCTSLGGELRDTLRALTSGAVVEAVDAVLRGAAAAGGSRRRCRPPRRIRWSCGYKHVTVLTADEVIRRRVLDRVCDAIGRVVGVELHESVDRLLSSAMVDAVGRVGRLVEAAVSRAEADMVRQAEEAGPDGSFLVEALGSARLRCSAALVTDSGPCRAETTSYFREACGLGFARALDAHATAFEQMMQSGCWWYAHWDFLIVCDPPCEIHRERVVHPDPGWHQLHRADGPAISFPDGWAIHAIHGRQMPAWVIEQPERITPQAIEAEDNAEVRRAMIERYGWSRYIADCGAEVIDQTGDDHPIVGLRGARLLRKELPGEPEPIVYLEMRNSTPEPDGTWKRYFERIDPKAYDGDAGRQCHAAMASRWRHVDADGRLQLTFERWQDYQPTSES